MHGVFRNISWLFLDKIFRMSAGLIVGAWVARYLGPEDYGAWNFAIAFAAIFGSFINFGLESILIRDLVTSPADENELMGSTFVIFVLGAFSAALLCMATYFSLFGWNELKKSALVLLSAISLLPHSFFVFNYFFQARTKAKIIVLSQGASFVLATASRVYLVLKEYSVEWFAIIGLAELLMAGLLVCYSYYRTGGRMTKWTYSNDRMRSLLKDGLPLMLANVASLLYMRIDQLMLGKMLGEKDVGIYSAAVKISEMWYFLPGIIGASFFPALVQAKDSKEGNENMMLFFEIMIGLGLLIAGLVSLVSPIVVNILFGDQYRGASSVLSVHVFGGIFVCMGIASGYWLTINGLQRFNLYRNLYGLLINVALNYLTIPIWGALGAAISSAVSQITALFLVDAINKETRPLFYIKLSSFKMKYVLARIRKHAWRKA